MVFSFKKLPFYNLLELCRMTITCLKKLPELTYAELVIHVLGFKC